MAKIPTNIRNNLIMARKILSSEGLVKGFGHVSARIPVSDLFVLTPRIGLELIREQQLLVLNLKGEFVPGMFSPPFEAPLHTAIFNKRPYIHAIARIHSRRAKS